MKNFIDDLELGDLPISMSVYFTDFSWSNLSSVEKRDMLNNSMNNLLNVLRSEKDRDKRILLKKQLSLINYYLSLGLSCKKVYELVTADKYELPICVADSLDEMSMMTGFNFNTLYSAFAKSSLIAKKYRLYSVDVRDPIEKFNFNDYKVFCRSKALRECDFNSLEQYKRQCYGG